jgi:hypothetical protein
LVVDCPANACIWVFMQNGGDVERKVLVVVGHHDRFVVIARSVKLELFLPSQGHQLGSVLLTDKRKIEGIGVGKSSQGED